MRNHEVTKVQELLKPDGSLREPGWSRQLYQVYEREKIKVPKLRIKEWDYYLVMSKDFGAAFTISDDGYIGLQSVSFLDFTKPWEKTTTILNPFPLGKFNLPTTSKEGKTVYRDKRLHMEFKVTEGKRRIRCKFNDFMDKKKFSCDITLTEPRMDSMVIATPWKEDRKAFYYNQKINCMPARGVIRLDDKEYRFDPKTDFGTLDWGRGVWTYRNRWYWASGNGRVNGKPFGFNLGYGFGDTSAASENMIFYDGKGHKLADVAFHIPKEGYMGKWVITSSDLRFEMDFVPVLDRAASMNALLVKTDQHQVFGKMSGRAVLDDGTVLEIKDLLCFAEDVYNQY